MTKNYKKGDALLITYKTSRGDVRQSVGIVFKISDLGITLGHNFSNLKPIDTTQIQITNILKSEKIIPREINSLEDLEDKNSSRNFVSV